MSSRPSVNSMRPIVLVVIVAAFAGSFVTDANAEMLYRRQVDQRNPGGKDLIMSAEELRRDPKISEIKVIFRSGASVPSSMFIVRAMYDIALERKAKYFVKLRERRAADGATIFLVGFSASDQVDPRKYFGLPDIEPAPEFMSVEMYRSLFGDEK
jgi:hypothetical protein